jgi:hypothetical protein
VKLSHHGAGVDTEPTGHGYERQAALVKPDHLCLLRCCKLPDVHPARNATTPEVGRHSGLVDSEVDGENRDRGTFLVAIDEVLDLSARKSSLNSDRSGSYRLDAMVVRVVPGLDKHLQVGNRVRKLSPQGHSSCNCNNVIRQGSVSLQPIDAARCPSIELESTSPSFMACIAAPARLDSASLV